MDEHPSVETVILTCRNYTVKQLDESTTDFLSHVTIFREERGFDRCYTHSTGSKILSNYNIKTLMLWACEMKGRSWWIDDLNVVGICVKLLHILADWLTDARCPHYFINDCNLFDSLDNSLTQNVAHRLQSVTEVWLAEWFVNNYICKCGDLCDDERVSRLFGDISMHVKLLKAVSALVDWKLSKTLIDGWCHLSIGCSGRHPHTPELYTTCTNEFMFDERIVKD